MTEVRAAQHKIAMTAERLPSREQRIDDVYPGIFAGNPRGAGDKGLEALDDAARALFVGDGRVAKRFFEVAVECISAGARSMAAGIGVDIEFEVDGRQYSGSAKQPSDLANPAKYLRALTSVIVLRAPKVADELVAVPMEVVEKAAGTMDAAYLRYVAAWRSFWQKAPDAAALLEEAAQLFDPSQLRVADPKSAARHSANIPTMQGLIENDSAKVNAGVVAALEAHKAWWGRGTRLNDPEGLIANQPAALASLALQRGMSLSVTSDYMPRWLLEGRDPE
ncbi:MAG TPA: immunity 49 family protein [Polyangiaceae bacterium]|nr:immunity 49 family protein [Polyangiaceae bacterium]